MTPAKSPPGDLRAITAQGLLDAGYARCHDPYSAQILGTCYLGSYRLRFIDTFGTRYVLAVHHGFRPGDEDRDWCEFFCPEVQFSRRGVKFNVELLPQDMTIGSMEAFCLDLWRGMGLDYAEHGAVPAARPSTCLH